MMDKIPFEPLEPGRKALVIVFLLIAVWYLTWRLGTFNKEAVVFSSLLYCAELYGFFTTLMHIFMTWRLTVREPAKPQKGLSVDVFITTYNEPVSLLRKTLLASKRLDYPHGTWLLDDGNCPEMKELARELDCSYLSRSENIDAKAGNLNNALLHSNAEFIAVFDADHAPKMNFLSRTLGYFQDPRVAFVQTPQDFYNLDSFQHHKKRKTALAWHEQTVFFRVIQRGKDYWNAAFFCGSCAVLRRSALDAIGGFATGTVTEDLHTSIRLHKESWKSVFHAESLAFGLAPSSMVAFLKQRIRWGQGAMQVWRKKGVFFGRGLTFAQRINYLASTITYFDGWQKGFFYIAPVIVLTTGTMPIVAFNLDFLLHFIPYFFLTFWVFEEVNRGHGRSLVIEQYNMARFAAMAWSIFGLFKSKIKFATTPKTNSHRSSHSPYILPQAVVMIGNALAIPIGLFLYSRYHHLPANGLVANVIWSSVNTLFAVSIYMLNSVYSKYKRVDYRFPIPLPAMLQFPDGNKYYGTIDNISSSGFRFYSRLPKGLSVGTELSGEMYLPSVPVKFITQIKALIGGKNGNERYVKAVGCTFQWSGNDEQDKLDLFLYASDMQLSLNNFREVIHTPLGVLTNIFSKNGIEVEKSPIHWNAISYNSQDKTEPGTGLISFQPQNTGRKNVLSLTPIPEGTFLEVDIYSRQGMTVEYGLTGACRQIDTPVSPVYIYQFNPGQAVKT
jgi:cellulose synthase (UDP-forming)